ncbi:hypothetical protein DSECCO2_565270 [anaerobic digester metagenome]
MGGLDGADGVEDVSRVAVGGIEDQEVGPGGEQRLGPLVAVGADADGRAHAQPAVAVLAGVGVFADLLDVLDGNEPAQLAVFVHHQQLFDAVFVQVVLGFLERRAHRHGLEVFPGHDVADLGHGVLDEAHVAVGDDADEGVAVDHGQARDAVFAHDHQRLLHGHVGRHGDGRDDHAGFGLLDLLHLEPLLGDGHVLVHHADPAAAGQGNGHAGLGDGIHGGADEGDVELDVRGQPRGDVGFVREHFRVVRQEQHVVESEPGFDDFVHCANLLVFGKVL